MCNRLLVATISAFGACNGRSVVACIHKPTVLISAFCTMLPDPLWKSPLASFPFLPNRLVEEGISTTVADIQGILKLSQELSAPSPEPTGEDTGKGKGKEKAKGKSKSKGKAKAKEEAIGTTPVPKGKGKGKAKEIREATPEPDRKGKGKAKDIREASPIPSYMLHDTEKARDWMLDGDLYKDWQRRVE